MEYADGGDLYQRVLEYQKKGRYMKESLVWDVAVQVTMGLQALHELKVFHRDLKSANVFLYQSGTVKLGDFNVSKASTTGFLYTQTGTPYYASPEVWQDLPYTLKSDIWSLGCVIYESAALKPPFRAEDMKGLYGKVMKGEFPRLPRCFSNELSAFVSDLLVIDPDRRPSCSEILSFPYIQRRIRNRTPVSSMETQSVLLRTISPTMPRLPAAHYETEEERPSLETEQSREEFALPKLAIPLSVSQRGRQGLTPDARMFESRLVDASSRRRRDSSDPSKSVTPGRYYSRVLRESYGGLQVVKRNFRISSLSRANAADQSYKAIAQGRKLRARGEREEDVGRGNPLSPTRYEPLRLL